jgi:hypothetical protein
LATKALLVLLVLSERAVRLVIKESPAEMAAMDRLDRWVLEGGLVRMVRSALEEARATGASASEVLWAEKELQDCVELEAELRRRQTKPKLSVV